MKRKVLVIIFVTASCMLYAQIVTNEVPPGLQYNISDSELSSLTIAPETDILAKKLKTKDKDPTYAGFSLPANILFSAFAQKQQINPDTILWRLKLNIPGAMNIGLILSDFHLPPQGKLFIYDENKKGYTGAITHENNTSSQILSIQTMPASSIIMEYFHPSGIDIELPLFTISEVIYIISNNNSSKAIHNNFTSGDCNVNVNCPEGRLWRKQQRGVARILLREGSDWFWCTGSLVNNTQQNGIPYFLTADHCGEDATEEDYLVWQFYFNYEYQTCEDAATTPQSNTATGSSLIARGPLTGGSDFKLLLLNNTLPLSWEPYFNGWNLTTTNPSSGTSIHHPLGDVKKISTYTSPLFNATYPGGITSGFWRVIWSETESGHGVTENGSSGSPIFDNKGLIVGTLSGGSASCSSPNSADIYGKFNRHWTANGTLNNERLKPWLDPNNENPQLLYGYDPNYATNFISINVNPETAGTVKGQGYFAEGEIIYLNAQPNNGYVFVNWTDQNNQVLSIDTSYLFVMSSREEILTANFKEAQISVYELHMGENIFIYPNPATNYLNLKTDTYLPNLSYALYDINGRKLKENQLFSLQNKQFEQQTISLAGFQNGIYFIRISTQDQSITHKIIIHK